MSNILIQQPFDVVIANHSKKHGFDDNLQIYEQKQFKSIGFECSFIDNDEEFLLDIYDAT